VREDVLVNHAQLIHGHWGSRGGEIGAISPEDAQQRNDHLQRAFHTETDEGPPDRRFLLGWRVCAS